MRAERADYSKVKQSLWPNTSVQSGIPIPLVLVAEDRVHRTIVRIDTCTCMCGLMMPHS